MIKVTILIKPCQNPLKNPASLPFWVVNSLDPAVQLKIKITKKHNRMILNIFSPPHSHFKLITCQSIKKACSYEQALNIDNKNFIYNPNSERISLNITFTSSTCIYGNPKPNI